MIALLKLKLAETLRAVVPLILVSCVLQFTFVNAPTEVFLQYLMGCAFVTAGLLLLLTGIDFGILPMGRFIGAKLAEKRALSLILIVAFLLGFATTVAEPDVLVLAAQVGDATQGTLPSRPMVYVIALGVAIFTIIGFLRIVVGYSMRWQLTVMYALMLVLTLLAPGTMIPLAYDAGSVTTGALAGPVVLAVGLGVSSVIGGRSTMDDAFGLLGVASIGPIIVILTIGWLMK
ncbi:MAG: hypothetical protein NAOJABEB_02697 [Steroidobacteraceae bacterium]|nr:hypothetical protein [Steroidobacteraceae bacterium]